MLLSVVIPFYQVEAYIGECLECAAQLQDCEVLLVADCGSDGSAQIAGRGTAACPRRATRALHRHRGSMSTFWTATTCPSRRR